MTKWELHFTDGVSLGDVLIGLVPVIAIVFNVISLRNYRKRPAVQLSDNDIKLIKNERTKLSASWANTIATGLLAAGFFPAVAALVKVVEGNGQPDWPLVLTGLSLTPFACVLHIISRFILRGLRA